MNTAHLVNICLHRRVTEIVFYQYFLLVISARHLLDYVSHWWMNFPQHASNFVDTKLIFCVWISEREEEEGKHSKQHYNGWFHSWGSHKCNSLMIGLEETKKITCAGLAAKVPLLASHLTSISRENGPKMRQTLFPSVELGGKHRSSTEDLSITFP